MAYEIIRDANADRLPDYEHYEITLTIMCQDVIHSKLILAHYHDSYSEFKNTMEMYIRNGINYLRKNEHTQLIVTRKADGTVIIHDEIVDIDYIFEIRKPLVGGGDILLDDTYWFYDDEDEYCDEH